jgi:hypothetical protein
MEDDIISTDEQLKKEGWQKQFTTDEPRLSEAIEFYNELGYEVRLEPPSEKEVLGNCGVCFEGTLDNYRTIYTRKRNEE